MGATGMGATGMGATGTGATGMGATAREAASCTAFQHATWCPFFSSTKGGSSAHFSKANGHRALNRQPVGGLRREGGRPGIPIRAASVVAHSNLGK